MHSFGSGLNCLLALWSGSAMVSSQKTNPHSHCCENLTPYCTELYITMLYLSNLLQLVLEFIFSSEQCGRHGSSPEFQHT
jgi:hypothetical protein